MKNLFLIILMFIFPISSIKSNNYYEQNNIIVVRNPLNSQEELYRYELQTIFMLINKVWDDGTTIVPVFIKFDSKLHKDFVRTKLHMNERTFNSLIKSKINSGKALGIIIAKNSDEVMNKVMSIPGAISYINGDVVMWDNEKIKKISIID